MTEPVIRVYIGRNLVIEERIVSDKVERIVIDEDLDNRFDIDIKDKFGNIVNLNEEIARELNLCNECLVVFESSDGFFICKDCLDSQYLEDISYDKLNKDRCLE